MIFIPDIIDKIVESMREVGSYTNVTINGTTHKIDSKNTLSVLSWVSIDNKEYKVISRTDNDFTIEATNIPAASDWKSLNPYYLFGHRLDIANRLLEKDGDEVFKYQKYPLIALRLPISQEKGSENIEKVSLNIAIMEFTNKNYPSEKRYSEVIKPILAPLYEKFLLAIENSSYFSLVGSPRHKRIDRLFWGVEEKNGNSAYIFNDPLDAIEIIDLELNIIDLNCKI